MAWHVYNNDMSNKKLSYKEVDKRLSKCGFKLLCKEYKNNLTPMECICKCGSRTKISLANAEKGQGCLECKRKSISKKLSIPDEEVIAYVKGQGMKFVKFISHRPRKRFQYICKCGNPSEINLDNFRKSPCCKKCGYEKISKENNYKWKDDREKILEYKLFSKRMGNMLRRYFRLNNIIKNNTKNEILGYGPNDLINHIKNHPNYNNNEDFEIDHIIPIMAFYKHGIKEPKIINCLENLRPLEKSLNTSKADKYDEKSFDIWMKSYNENLTKRNDSYLEQIMSFKEWVDGYGIKNAFMADPVLCMDRNHLIDETKEEHSFVIFPHEWKYKKEIIKPFLYFKENKPKRINARDCFVVEIDQKTSNNFIDQYHFQKSNKLGIISWGIFDEISRRLIGVLSLGRNHRQNQDMNNVVLDRLCFKSNIQIFGGASKLLKPAKEWAFKNNFNIISYSDNRLSNGNVYEKMGFSLLKENYQDYFYLNKFDFTEYKSKQSQRKDLVSCPESLTEHEWAISRGLIRVWDMGKKTWILTQ